MTLVAYSYIKQFSDLCLSDVPLVGQKIAALAEIHRELAKDGVLVPPGFAITAEAFRELTAHVNFRMQLDAIFSNLNLDNFSDMAKRAKAARELIYHLPLPPEMVTQVIDEFRKLRLQFDAGCSVAVRSSIVSTSFPTASFAGQQASFLHITTEEQLIEAIRECFVSVFSERAIYYRFSKGFNYDPLPLSICIMKMVGSDSSASGVIFTIDPESGFRDVSLVTATYGLGDVLVQGMTEPDQFYVFKPGVRAGRREILYRTKGGKKLKSIYTKGRKSQTTRIVATTKKEQEHFSLNDLDVLLLTDMAMTIENHFTRVTGAPQALNIEWAKDGATGQLYILQARPETVVSQRQDGYLEEYRLILHRSAIISGLAVGNQIAFGFARLIKDVHQFKDFKEGDILVAEMTTPDWLPVMRLAAAIITSQGGRTSHTAIIARELGIPAVVACNFKRNDIATGDILTVSCVEGMTGYVYAGRIPFKKIRTDLAALEKKRNISLLHHIDEPNIAFKTSQLPNDGVGLLRISSLLSHHLFFHPMAFVQPEKMRNKRLASVMRRLQQPFDQASDYFIQRLSECIAMIAAAYFPKPVMLAFSDFTSAQFASLIGGTIFEPEEDNPILGLRGAARLVHPLYLEAFKMECLAIKRVREVMGFTNIKLLLPFCRTLQEAEKVLKKMEEFGLQRGINQLDVHLMCETPNNILAADHFADLFDGFSIEPEQLIQLLLGCDLHSPYDLPTIDMGEPSVLEMTGQLMQSAQKHRKPVIYFANAHCDSPTLIETLVKMKMSVLSVKPEVVVRLIEKVMTIESEMSDREAT
jgi:pyruvate,water dikinase